MPRQACLLAYICAAVALVVTVVHAQNRPRPSVPEQSRAAPAPPQRAAEPRPPEDARARANTVLSAITLADIGFGNGLRFANLGGRRDVFVPLPQGADITAAAFVLAVDDVSAHEARRSLEVLVNDRIVSAIALDGKGAGRTVRIPLGNAKPRDGFLKFSFLYSGAATQDRCIDVRYVGDSLTIRPESAVEIEVAFGGSPDVATTAALMPRDVAVVLPRRRLEPSDMATALTVAHSLAASGRRVAFHHGIEALPELVKRDDPRSWTRGVVVVGPLQDVLGYLDTPVATIAGPTPAFGDLIAARVSGLPVLIVSDAVAVRAGRLLGSPSLAATRGVTAASVGDVSGLKLPTAQVNFDQLGILLPQAEVFGRAELPVTIDRRSLPAGTRPARLILDVMVAPDGAGEKAVISAFVNERLMESAVAAAGEPTKLDLALPDGLFGTVASVRAVVQRRSAQGDCRFEPQGYPAQILGSSAVVLASAEGITHDFSDLVPHWSNGVEVLLPDYAAERPLMVLDMVTGALNALAAEAAPFNVTFVAPGTVSAPAQAFIAVSEVPPADTSPRVRFDHGRVAVADRSGKVLLDLGGFSSGAVAQVVNAGAQAGLWIKPLAADGALPATAGLRLDRGNVAFIDKSGVALAMSTERDTLIRVTYPDQVSWLTVADRFRPWIIGGLWALATLGFMIVLQRMFRRRPTSE